MASPYIALLTDFGTAAWYVACMKAVILDRCGAVRLVDITHEIPPYDVMAGAFILAMAAPWFPAKTVFACVVDPGVGTARPLIAAHADDHFFVGPDNGLLSLAIQRAKRLSLIRLTNPRYWLPQISQTFQGRDIIAPVAAHLACGCPLTRLGVPTTRYQSLALEAPRRSAQGIEGAVLHIDPFGNLITNVPVKLLAESPPHQIRYRRMRVRMVSSYVEGRSGELVALKGSTGYLELAVCQQSAAKRYRARRGDRVHLLGS